MSKLATRLATEFRVVVGQLRRVLRAQARFSECSASQVAVLAHLERNGPATGTTLARAEGVRPQSMGATLAALEDIGYVKGAPDPNDGRQTIWTMTAACHRRVAQARAVKEDWLARMIETKLTRKEQEQLAVAAELLQRLVQTEAA